MGKYKIIVDGIKLDGLEIEKDCTVNLPWQIGDSYVVRGWAEKAGDDDDTDSGGSKKLPKNRNK